MDPRSTARRGLLNHARPLACPFALGGMCVQAAAEWLLESDDLAAHEAAWEAQGEVERQQEEEARQALLKTKKGILARCVWGGKGCARAGKGWGWEGYCKEWDGWGRAGGQEGEGRGVV